EQRVRSFLARFETNPQFVIMPMLRVVVGGEVRQPNVYTVPPGTSVAQAIAMAGGPTDRGRLDRVRLLRGKSSLLLDLTSPSEESARTQMRSGDEIAVQRRRSIFQDYVAPGASVVAAMAALASIIIQLRK